jgi:hypothetical protein
VTFAWQFLPILGQSAVKPGIRNVFAQLAVPKPDVTKSLCSGHVYARTRWIPGPTEHYLFAPPPPAETYPKQIGEIYEYDTAPYSFSTCRCGTSAMAMCSPKRKEHSLKD